MTLSTQEMQKQVLDDVTRITGLSYARIAGIDTRTKAIADAVLPVLKAWFQFVTDPDLRHAIYACFHTPHASPHIDSVLDWWQQETDQPALSTLTQALALIAKPKDAQRLWKLCSELPCRPFQYMLLAKPAQFPAVQREVRDFIVEALETDASIAVADLECIAKVPDSRIRQWFEKRLESENRCIQILARKVAGRAERLPRGVTQLARLTAPRRSTQRKWIWRK